MRGASLAVFISILLWGQVSYAAEVGPAPRTYVEDRAEILDAQKTQLIGLLQDLEQKAAARIVVLTVQTTEGMDIHQYAFERADQWKFGPNKKSAGVLVVVAVKDRKYWTEVGYDWEGTLPDGLVGELGRKYFVPYFKQKAYGEGILQYTASIAQIIAKEKQVQLTGMPTLRGARRGPAMPCAGGMFPLLMLMMMFGRGRRTRGLLFWGLLGGTMMGSRHHGGGFGGGFGGGGFGGFGMGGGGGFGGGGAGGGW